MELVNAISMFGYTVVFGIIGIILYSAFKNNSKNRRKGDKQYGIYCNPILVYEIKFNCTTHRCDGIWVDSYYNNSQYICMFDVVE